MPFIHKKRAFYQDRLGTNMGKLEKERPFVLRWPGGRGAAQRAGKETSFVRHFCSTTTTSSLVKNLPRQTRDKHKRNFKREHVFLQDEHMAVGYRVRKWNDVFWAILFKWKVRSVYQDRLGTNITGTVDEKRLVFCRSMPGVNMATLCCGLVREPPPPSLQPVSVHKNRSIYQDRLRRKIEETQLRNRRRFPQGGAGGL